ncbi:thioesterase, partial [Pseudomonas sp. GD04058]|nr:thioesterase [Pseudomonas sp. GD04058]
MDKSESSLLQRAERFLSALRHCQVLNMQVDCANGEGIT